MSLRARILLSMVFAFNVISANPLSAQVITFQPTVVAKGTGKSFLIRDFDQWERNGVSRGFDVNRLATNTETSRGVGAAVYAKIAPAIVWVLNFDGSSGTGFVIRDDGWLLTNHHVIDDARYSAEHGAQIARVYWGTLDKDGWMKRSDEVLTGIVYRIDKRSDLALIKIESLPKGVTKFPAIKFADSAPPPGSDCVAIGHPAAGTLWTLRQGELSGDGTFPQDQLDLLTALLTSSEKDRAEIKKFLENHPERKRVFLSTCGLNPGDSGGPLLNEKAEVIGVSQAVPLIDVERQVDLGKFSFHIHLSEVKAFIQEWPTGINLAAPNSLPLGTHMKLDDVDSNGTPDIAIFNATEKGNPTGFVFDLDENSQLEKKVKEANGSLALSDIDYEYVERYFPQYRVGFDTDNSGDIDLVLSDETGDDRELDTLIRRVGGKWKVESVRMAKFPFPPFEDAELNNRFEKLLSKSFKVK